MYIDWFYMCTKCYNNFQMVTATYIDLPISLPKCIYSSLVAEEFCPRLGCSRLKFKKQIRGILPASGGSLPETSEYEFLGIFWVHEHPVSWSACSFLLCRASLFWGRSVKIYTCAERGTREERECILLDSCLFYAEDFSVGKFGVRSK